MNIVGNKRFIILKVNTIYSTSIALFIGSLGAIACRKDLTKKILAGGVMFLGLYFIFFLFFNWVFPGYVEEVWNFSAISGIIILGVPIEELLFALTLGMFWSSLYEHLTWRTLIHPVRSSSHKNFLLKIFMQDTDGDISIKQ